MARCFQCPVVCVVAALALVSGDEADVEKFRLGQQDRIRLVEMLYFNRTDDGEATWSEQQPGAWKLHLHPNDDGAGMNPLLWTNPHMFEPQANPETGMAEAWGLFAPDPAKPRERWPTTEEGQTSEELREQRIQRFYHPVMGSGRFKQLGSPMEQFVRVLMDRKQATLDAIARLRTSVLASEIRLRVAIVSITNEEQTGGLHEPKPSIWRRVAVPGNVTLRDLHDRVLAPTMGWKRGYHAYYYCDPRDGAVLGPRDFDAVDKVHASYRIGCRSCMLDDAAVMLGQLVSHPGDRLSYTYDLGDHWHHMLSVEAIFSKSTLAGGQPRVLDGAMACPPEDTHGIPGMGIREYEKQVLHHPNVQAGRPLPVSMQRALGAAVNYRSESFDPRSFKRSAAQRRVNAAWKGEGSYFGGDGKVGISMGVFGEETLPAESSKPRYAPVPSSVDPTWEGFRDL